MIITACSEWVNCVRVIVFNKNALIMCHTRCNIIANLGVACNILGMPARVCVCKREPAARKICGVTNKLK